jgi:N-acetyl-gamma-glutamylphosphate reductase
MRKSPLFFLNTRYKTFVNGTQGYLGKKIRALLQEEYPNIEVKTYQNRVFNSGKVLLSNSEINNAWRK